MKIKYLGILFVAVLLNIQAGFTQIIDPVKWTSRLEKISEKEVYLVFEAKIESHWHMYAQEFGGNEPGPVRMSWTFPESSQYKRVGGVQEITKPIKEFDDIFGIDVKFFDGKAVLKQKIEVLSSSDFNITTEVHYQVCSDEQCINFDKEFTFSIKGVAAAVNTTEKEEVKEETVIENNEEVVEENPENEAIEENTNTNDSIPAVSDEKEGALKTFNTGKTPVIVTQNEYSDLDTKGKSSLIWFFFISMLFGLTALVTPCVFPMIPMTVSFFMHSGENKAKGKMQAITYGISIVLIYTIPIAILVAISNLFGSSSISADFANFLSTHWIPNILFFVIFVVFAASFFGMFEITLPNWMLNKSDQKASQGGLMGTFFMAFTLVLVSFSCTGPIVGGILVESTQGGQIIKPLIGMFGFSLGVALPFTMFAFFPELLKKLPKSGGWLNSVKVVLGFLELALGLKFLSVADQTYGWGILDREIYIALWIVIFALMGLYLLGKLKFAHDSDVPYVKVPRLLMGILTFSFVLYLLPGLWGAPLKALAGYLPPKSTHDFDLIRMIEGDQSSTLCEEPKYADELHLPHGLKGYFDIHQAIRCAKEKNKPIFIDFTGHGCVNCREMEDNVWSDPRVLQLLKEEYVVVALYVDDKNIELPEEDWFTSTYDKGVKKMLGKQNADIQIVNFNKNSQPYYVLLDYNGVVLENPVAYDLDPTKFYNFLESGLKRYKKLHAKEDE